MILVAHDRWFLEAVGTSVLELEAGRSRFFPGSWHAWRREAAAREIQLGKQIEKQQAEIARMERFIERFRYKATKARQAQSRVKKLEKMDRIERDPTDNRSLGFRFGGAERAGRVVIHLEEGRLEVPGRTLLEDGELWLERGEHVSLVGPNGAGKTTLIEALAGRRELDGGRLRTGHNVQLGYLSQHAEELGSSGTVLEAAQRATGLTPNKARALLGRFLFSGAEAEKPMEGLSGGERRRLSLAILVSSGANVLILDEPTNHLDIDAREALEDALSGFDGNVLLVSHDRALLDAVGTRTIAMEDGRLRSYQGGWAEYSRVREERRDEERARPGREKRATAKAKAAKSAGNGARQARRPVQERDQARGPARARGGEGRGRAARDRGRAGGPLRLGEPDEQRARNGAPRSGEEGGRGGLRALGGRLEAGRNRLAPPDAERGQVEAEDRVQHLAAHARRQEVAGGPGRERHRRHRIGGQISIQRRVGPAGRRGSAVNTAANETRPSLAWGAARLYFGRAQGLPVTADIWVTTRQRVGD